MARISLINQDNVPNHLKNDVAVNREATQALFENSRDINSVKLTSHIPLIERWLLPLIASMQRNGAGSVVPAKIKSLVDIKTSLVNNCDY